MTTDPLSTKLLLRQQGVVEKVTTYGAGRTLFKQGEKGGELFFIKEGQVSLIVRNAETGDEAEIAVLGPKTVLGTMSFLEGDPRSATAITKTEVKCVKISQIHRDKLLETIPSWFGILLKDLSMNIRRLNGQFLNLDAEHKKLDKRYQIAESRRESLEQELEKLRDEKLKSDKAAAELEAILRGEIKLLKKDLREAQKAASVKK